MPIVEKLTAIKRKVGSVGKDAENKEGGRKFHYRSIDGVVNAVAQALVEEGVIIHSTSAELLASEQIVYGKNNTPGIRTTLAVEYEWTDGESSITSQVVAESIDSGDKGTAKAMSVAYRIAILQTLTLPTGERDPDADVYEVHGYQTPAQRLLSILSESSFPPALAREIIGSALGKLVTKLDDIKDDEYERAIQAIESAIVDRDQLENER